MFATRTSTSPRSPSGKILVSRAVRDGEDERVVAVVVVVVVRPADRDPVQLRVDRRGSDRHRVEVDPDRARRAHEPRADREDAASRAEVDDFRAAQNLSTPPEPAQAQPRRRVLARAEREAGLQDDAKRGSRSPRRSRPTATATRRATTRGRSTRRPAPSSARRNPGEGVRSVEGERASVVRESDW